MERTTRKSPRVNISHIRNVWREGQSDHFDIIKKTNFSHALKSRYSRRCLDQVGVLNFHEECSLASTNAVFDEQLCNFQLSHEINLLNSDWVYICPYFMHCGARNHVTSFKIDALLHAVPPQCGATTLCYRNKRGHPKKFSSALIIDSIQEVVSIDDKSDDDHEDTKTRGVAARIDLVALGGCRDDQISSSFWFVQWGSLTLFFFIFNIFTEIDTMQINSTILFLSVLIQLN